MADIPDCHCGALLQSALAGVQEAFQSSNGVWGQNGTEFAGMSLLLCGRVRAKRYYYRGAEMHAGGLWPI
jgi:hypothetical protein